MITVGIVMMLSDRLNALLVHTIFKGILGVWMVFSILMVVKILVHIFKKTK